MTLFLSVFAGSVIGSRLQHWWENRIIDHGWYCGRSHMANLPCAPKDPQ